LKRPVRPSPAKGIAAACEQTVEEGEEGGKLAAVVAHDEVAMVGEGDPTVHGDAVTFGGDGKAVGECLVDMRPGPQEELALHAAAREQVGPTGDDLTREAHTLSSPRARRSSADLECEQASGGSDDPVLPRVGVNEAEARQVRAANGGSAVFFCQNPSRGLKGIRAAATSSLPEALTMPTQEDILCIGKHEFRSRLFVGTGKYKDVDETRHALLASGAEVVTVALRRVNLGERGEGSMMSLLSERVDGRPRFTLLPNTAGCYSVEDALRTCHLARELGMSDLVKLEVIGDEKTLFPDNAKTVEAAKILVAEGFTVLPYCTDDPIVCRQLEELGCAAVMPLAAPIGSGLGIRNPYNLRIILEQAKVPIIVDAGVGTASDAAIAMELGCHGVLMNTAIAAAKDPVRMATAMRLAVEAGRLAYLAGRMPRRLYAHASSPMTGMIE
jgi:thiazole synthase